MSSGVASILADMGAILTGGHFVYASRKHGGAYVAKDVLYTDPVATSAVCAIMTRDIADYLKERGVSRDIAVVAPVVGGVALSQWVGFHLRREGFHSALALFAEKVEGEAGDAGEFALKRGYDKLVKGKPVVVVEDILNTGGSALATVKAVAKADGNVVLVAAVCNRGGVTAEQLGVPFLISAMEVSLDAYDAAACPLCARGAPISTSHGHGAKFLAEKAAADNS